MGIEWPEIAEEELEQVDDESIEKDAFQANCFSIEKRRDGGAHINVKVPVEVVLTQGMLAELMCSPTFVEDLADTIMQRLLVDMNMCLLPVMRYKIEQFKNRKLRIH